MMFYWARDRVKQSQFIKYWRPGADNLDDYHTKHHPLSHHIKIQSNYVHDLPQQLNIIRWGCAIIINMDSALNVLTKVNDTLRRNIEVHTNIET